MSPDQTEGLLVSTKTNIESKNRPSDFKSVFDHSGIE